MLFSHFNRALNVAQHFRTIGGKKVLVTGHKRSVLKLQSALQSLRSRGTAKGRELLYNINPKTGNVGRINVGSKTQVSQEFLPRKGNTVIPRERITQANAEARNKVSRWILHNHPSKAGINYSDLRNATKNNQIFAITKDNSVYRGYIKNSKAASRLKKGTELVMKNWRVPKGMNPDDFKQLAAHRINLKARDFGDIHYRVKKSPNLKELENKYGKQVYSQIDRLLEPVYGKQKTIRNQYKARAINNLNKYKNIDDIRESNKKMIRIMNNHRQKYGKDTKYQRMVDRYKAIQKQYKRQVDTVY